MPPLEWPAAPISFGSTRPDSGPLAAADALSTWSMTKLMSPGWFPMSPPSGPPGVSLFERGNRGAATTYPAAAQAVSSCWYCWGEPPRPWAKTISGYGLPPDAAADPDLWAGYQMVVTRVREALAGMPSHAGVAREVSTKVIVVCATGVALAAPATAGGLAISGPPTISKRPKVTAPSATVRCIAPIPAAQRAMVVSVFLDNHNYCWLETSRIGNIDAGRTHRGEPLRFRRPLRPLRPGSTHTAMSGTAFALPGQP